jgi:predicted alpha/beta-hydrolase family hydrolase
LTSQDQIIQRVIAAGFPTRAAEREFVYRVQTPKYFVQSTHDEFGPRPDLAAFFETLPEPKHLDWIDASDHFFADALDKFEGVIERIGTSR